MREATNLDDIHFDCPACHGSLVADGNCAGISLSCPHCQKWIQVPYPHGAAEDHAPHNESLRHAVHGVLESELEAARTKLRKAKADLTSLEAKVKASEEEAAGLRERLEKAGSGLREQHLAMEAELISLRAQVGRQADDTNRVKELEEQLEAEKKARNEAEVAARAGQMRLEDYSTIKSELAAAQKEIKQFESKLQNAAHAQEKLKTELAQAHEETIRLQQEGEEQQKRYKTVLSTAHEEKETLEKKVAALEQEHAGREREVSSLVETARNESAARIQALEAGYQSFAAERLALEQAHSETQGQLQSVTAEHGLLQEEKSTLEQKLAALEQKLSRQQNELPQLLETAKAEVQPRIAAIEAERDAVAENLTAAHGRIQELEAHLQKLETERAALQGTHHEASELIQNVSNECEQLRKEKTALEDLVTQHQGESDALRECLAQLQKDSESLSGALSAELQNHQETRATLEESLQQLALLQSAHDERLQLHETLHRSFAQVDEKLAEIRKTFGATSGR